MMTYYLDFEKPIAALEDRVKQLRQLAQDSSSINVEDELAQLEEKLAQRIKKTYADLDAWQKTQIARHPLRPHFSDYIDGLIEGFMPLAGDRLYAEDQAIIAGLGYLKGQAICILGHEKGRDTQGRLKHNFGMARPEGYRKAVRLFDLADRFGLPVVSFVDTSGAYPGVGAEERGQAEAIARAIDKAVQLKVPFVSVVIGEGGSGGALAIAVANKIIMLEHAIYSVASPEACASILWRSRDKAKEAAIALKLTAQSLQSFKVIDKILEEPLGGAHRNSQKMIQDVGESLEEALRELMGLSPEELATKRREKFLKMGRDLL